MFWFVFWWLHGAWIRVAPKTGMIQEKKIMNQTKDFKHQNHIQSPCDGIIVIVNVVHILQGTNKITWIEHFSDRVVLVYRGEHSPDWAMACLECIWGPCKPWSSNWAWVFVSSDQLCSNLVSPATLARLRISWPIFLGKVGAGLRNWIAQIVIDQHPPGWLSSELPLSSTPCREGVSSQRLTQRCGSWGGRGAALSSTPLEGEQGSWGWFGTWMTWWTWRRDRPGRCDLPFLRWENFVHHPPVRILLSADLKCFASAPSWGRPLQSPPPT